MRHKVFGKKFNRDIKQRKSLFKNLITSLVMNEEIQTTESKAKAIKGVIDKLIAYGKKGTLHVRRTISAFLQNSHAVNKIVDELGPRFKNRISGFTRIIRIGERRGDNAMIVRLELVEKKEKEQPKEREAEGAFKKEVTPAKEDTKKEKTVQEPETKKEVADKQKK